MTTATTELDPKARVRRSLPTVPLEAIRIASPCTVSWAAMSGDEKSRHCGQCRKTVHDLSKMTRAEAEALVSSGDKVCVRLWVRKDGTVLTEDCPTGLERVRRHLRRVGAVLGALLGVLGLTGCPGDTSASGPTTTSPTTNPATGSTPTGPDVEPRPLMGEVCAPDPSPPGSGTPTTADPTPAPRPVATPSR